MNKRRIALLVQLAGVCAVINGQTTNTGSLSGTVTDQSGSIVQGAAIRVSNSANGLSRESKTGDSGIYRVDLLPAGIYTVKISMLKFTTAVSENVGVAV